MRLKIMLHYALSFFFTCLFIVIVNILYMRSSVYQDNQLYRYDPQPQLDAITSALDADPGSGIRLAAEYTEYLQKQGGGMQLLDSAMTEVLRAGKLPASVSASYSASRLLELYGAADATTFAGPATINGNDYTILLFLDPSRVRRTLYTFNVAQVSAAYNLLWLVGMNVLLLLLVSFMYTYSISRPVQRITGRILALARGRYEGGDPAKGIYAAVEEAMNQLASQLDASRQERELADAAREEWIANLSHDIKTPLTSMMGYAELLGDSDHSLPPDEQARYRDLILDKGRYIKTLLADLNLATRLKHRQIPLKLEPVNVVEVIKKELIDILNSSAADGSAVVSSRHSIAFTHNRDYAGLQLDRRLFGRALANLVHNAFVHNSEPVALLVHLEAAEDRQIQISIDDNGKGLAPEELPRIFSRYYRGTNTANSSEGSGLGMAIAKDIIEAHGGHISAQLSPRGGLAIHILLRRPDHETVS
ncbi:MAG: hypothetical protein KKI09_10235 [Spirochaetes bacterium]|nr:hypothetical protein [Spirochaetota bacterium]